MTPDLIYDQLIGRWLRQQGIFSWGGKSGSGLTARLRERFRKWLASVDRKFLNIGTRHMALCLRGGAAGLPLAYIARMSAAKFNPK